MTKSEFKKRDRNNKISLLDMAIDETWWNVIQVMGKTKDGKYNDAQMSEIYGIVTEFNEKMKNVI